MGPFIERWRRIGTRLYLALGIAVILTLISGAVGVFYFEQSGDLNYQVRNESVPALEATWTVARETERLRNLGLGLAAEPDLGFQGLARGTVVDSLERLDSALNVVSGVAELSAGAQAVSDAEPRAKRLLCNATQARVFRGSLRTRFGRFDAIGRRRGGNTGPRQRHRYQG